MPAEPIPANSKLRDATSEKNAVPEERKLAAVKATAQTIADDDARAAAGCDPIRAEEVIVEPNPSEYIAPDYLQKTAPQLARAIGELFDLLRDLTARFVGERTVEVQATLSLTGEHEWLEEKFLGWCQMYFKIRGSLDR